MGEIIARFADGRILVQEEKLCEQGYKMSGYSTYGVPFRIGHIKTVENVLSVDAHVSGYPGDDGRLVAPLKEVGISGDTILVILRKGDLGQMLPALSGGCISAYPGHSVLSGITSGIPYLGELISGLTPISGVVNIVANVLGI